jgi:hypothetical protein
MLKVFWILSTTIIITNLLFSVNTIKLRYLEEEAYKDPIYDPFLFVRDISCKVTNCPSPNTCVMDNTVCKCLAGMADYQPDVSKNTPNAVFCTYERKKQLTAFLLQFFIFCAGQFYVGNIQYAIPQLLLTILLCVLGAIKSVMKITFFAQKDENDEPIERPCKHSIIIWTVELLTVTLFVWWLADIIIFGMNNYVDKHGIPLIPW